MCRESTFRRQNIYSQFRCVRQSSDSWIAKTLQRCFESTVLFLAKCSKMSNRLSREKPTHSCLLLYSLIKARSRCQRQWMSLVCMFFIPTSFSLLYHCTCIILLLLPSERDATVLDCVSWTLRNRGTEKWSHGTAACAAFFICGVVPIRAISNVTAEFCLAGARYEVSSVVQGFFSLVSDRNWNLCSAVL